ncbi:SMP-30/gluconolactonase/LRE family protein [Coxiella-like endosymbiont]|uniref:SMP-30/gluconolactonase/LRE family protein n=1 Tax=Coxiella-like endosymbiont TaxID=1592897 RepID=UPI00272A62E2|nr:SMP-30/gluconolactonase/LRE family protein [Coxiella-like endosymbiont]
MEKGITISNGFGFSPDDQIFYYTDGFKYPIYQYDFDINHEVGVKGLTEPSFAG